MKRACTHPPDCTFCPWCGWRKLSGPRGFQVRLVIGVAEAHAVVTGVFPPELAAEKRRSSEFFSAWATAQLDAVKRELSARMRRGLLFGDWS